MKEAREKVSGRARAEFDAKIESSSKFLATITTEESVVALLDDLEKTFDKIEDQLEKSRKGTRMQYGCSQTFHSLLTNMQVRKKKSHGRFRVPRVGGFEHEQERFPFKERLTLSSIYTHFNTSKKNNRKTW